MLFHSHYQLHTFQQIPPSFHSYNTSRTFIYNTIMSSSEQQADAQYEQQNNYAGGDVPAGDKGDNDYVSRTGQSQIPVQSDQAGVEDPIDPASADSDQTLRMS